MGLVCFYQIWITFTTINLILIANFKKEDYYYDCIVYLHKLHYCLTLALLFFPEIYCTVTVNDIERHFCYLQTGPDSGV